MTAAGLPSVVLVRPVKIPLVGEVNVTIFLKNFPNLVYKGSSDPPTCAQVAKEKGLKVKSQNIVNPVNLNLEDSNGMLVLKFLAPASETAGEVTGQFVLNDAVVELEFVLST